MKLDEWEVILKNVSRKEGRKRSVPAVPMGRNSNRRPGSKGPPDLTDSLMESAGLLRARAPQGAAFVFFYLFTEIPPKKIFTFLPSAWNSEFNT